MTTKEALPMFTPDHRSLLLRAHDVLEKTIKFTNGGLAALGAGSADVKRISLAAVSLKKLLDDAHDRDRFEFDPSLRDVGALALSILVGKLEKLRKDQLSLGINNPEDTDHVIDLAKQIGRDMNAALFPQTEVQAELAGV